MPALLISMSIGRESVSCSSANRVTDSGSDVSMVPVKTDAFGISVMIRFAASRTL